jgi:hypothetical protein
VAVEAFTAAAVSTRPEAVDPIADRIRHLPLATEPSDQAGLPHSDPRVAPSRLAPGIAILGPAAISQAETADLGIPPRHPLRWRMDNGIHLVGQITAAKLRVRNRELDPQVTKGDSVYLAEIAE